MFSFPPPLSLRDISQRFVGILSRVALRGSRSGVRVSLCVSCCRFFWIRSQITFQHQLRSPTIRTTDIELTTPSKSTSRKTPRPILYSNAYSKFTKSRTRFRLKKQRPRLDNRILHRHLLPVLVLLGFQLLEQQQLPIQAPLQILNQRMNSISAICKPASPTPLASSTPICTPRIRRNVNTNGGMTSSYKRRESSRLSKL